MTPATACSVREWQRSRQRGCRARGSMRRTTRASTSLCCARYRRAAQTAAARAEQVRQPQARFADDDVALDEDVVARETAGTLKGMVVGGEAKGLSAPTTEAIKREARGGACEAWPRAFVHDGNPLGERAPPRRRQIIIETKMESVCS